MAATGRIYPLPAGAKDVVVKDRAGKAVASQIVRSSKDLTSGNLIVAEVAFQAQQVPSAGYDTYYLDFTSEAAPPVATDLKIDEAKLTLENEHLPRPPGPGHRRHRQPGAQGLRPRDARRRQGALPAADRPAEPGRGQAHAPQSSRVLRQRQVEGGHRLAGQGAGAGGGAGPARPGELRFETRISLAAGARCVEIYSRMLTLVPPKPDVHPADIKEGYWFSLAPSFPATTLLRDYPFGVEPTKNPTFHALTFVDLVGKDAGLLVLHPATQFFRRHQGGRGKNLRQAGASAAGRSSLRGGEVGGRDGTGYGVAGGITVVPAHAAR